MSVAYFPFVEQGTQEWLDLRSRCVATCSEFAAAIGLCPYKSRARLLKQKLGIVERDEQNGHMLFGQEWEPEVANAYETLCDARERVCRYGFVTYTTKSGLLFGGSPDRVVYENGRLKRLVEIKCSQFPRTTVELYHMPQLLGQCAMLDCWVNDYVCWSPEQVDRENQCILLNIGRVEFDRRLWDDHVLPELEYFASLLERQITPSQIDRQRKRQLLDAFEKYTTVKGPMFTYWLFPVEGDEMVRLPAEATIASAFKSQCSGWEQEGSLLIAVCNDDRSFVLLHDLRFHADPPSPFNRAWEKYVHTGQLSSAIPLIRGPAVMMCASDDLVATRDHIEQHFLQKELK